MILDVTALTSREMEKNGISAQTKLAESPPAIQGDRVQLQQVMLNLLINAIEAMSGMSEGPRKLLISTANTNSGVVVSVQDSGLRLMPEIWVLLHHQIRRIGDGFIDLPFYH